MRPMKTRTLFVAAALASGALTLSFVGCGSSSNNSNPGTDSGTSGEGGENDSSTVDSGSSGDSGSKGDSSTTTDSGTKGDSGMMANCTPPSGTPLVASSTVSVQGITSDDQVIYYETSAKHLHAIPAAGGTDVDLGAWDAGQTVVINGKVALFWQGTAAQTKAPAFGKLFAFTAAGGVHQIATSAWAAFGTYDVTSDGASILYTDNATLATGDFKAAAIDGTGATTLQAGVNYSANPCVPFSKFIGSMAVLGYCGTAPADAGTSLFGSITGYSGTGWATKKPFAVLDAFTSFSGDKAGTQIAYVTNSGQYVQGTGVTAVVGTLIDSKGTGGANFTSDGLNLVYFEAGGLYRSNIATPAPQAVALGTYAGTYGLSGDDNFAYLYKSVASNGFTTDLYLTSTAGSADGGTATTLSSMTNAGLFGPGWTADNAKAIYFTNIAVSPNNSQAYVGDFDVLGLPPSAMANKFTTNCWEEWTTTGSKVLYNDAYTTGGNGTNGAADIKGADFGAATPTPTLLVSAADANFFVSADHTKYTYSWNNAGVCPGGKPGLYVATAP